jgi:hypothetical protein
MFEFQSTYDSGKEQGSLKLAAALDLDDPVFQNAIINLPDDKRALAAKILRGSSAQNDEILDRILKQEPALPNALRAQLADFRSRRPRRVPAVATLPNAAISSPVTVSDDADPTRLKASVKTPTGEFNDVSASLCATEVT